MIRLERASLTPTPRLLADQAALAAVADVDGPRMVAARGDAGWTSMRVHLDRAQQQKCAYCEDDLAERQNEVDHVRPKGASLYWWLAFELNNLVLACRTCNSFKHNKWDLEGGRRLRPRELPWVVRERAKFVDPTIDDPALHLTYVFAQGRWRIAALSDRGQWTIDVLALDRDSFLRRSNEWILEAVDPAVEAYTAAAEAGDVGQAREAINRLATFASSSHRWAHLGSTLMRAVQDGIYERPI